MSGLAKNPVERLTKKIQILQERIFKASLSVTKFNYTVDELNFDFTEPDEKQEILFPYLKDWLEKKL